MIVDGATTHFSNTSIRNGLLTISSTQWKLVLLFKTVLHRGVQAGKKYGIKTSKKMYASRWSTKETWWSNWFSIENFETLTKSEWSFQQHGKQERWIDYKWLYSLEQCFKARVLLQTLWQDWIRENLRKWTVCAAEKTLSHFEPTNNKTFWKLFSTEVTRRT